MHFKITSKYRSVPKKLHKGTVYVHITNFSCKVYVTIAPLSAPPLSLTHMHTHTLYLLSLQVL